MTKRVPKGFHSLTPHITVKDARQAIAFYEKAFGANRIRCIDMGGMIGHAEIRIGDSILMLNDEFPGQASAPPADLDCLSLHLYVDDADALFEKATRAGCSVVMLPMDMFWGDRYGKVRDPFGYTWSIAHRIEELTDEEIAERAKQMFAQG
jgi:PhnB protein